MVDQFQLFTCKFVRAKLPAASVVEGKAQAASGHPTEEAIVYNAGIGTIVISGDRPVKVRSVGLDRNERGCGSFFRNHLMNLRAESGWISHSKSPRLVKLKKSEILILQRQQ